MSRRAPSAVSAAMRQVRSKNTSPEIILRKPLWAKGLRYRLHSKDLPGHPDLVFSAARVAVFVDGDFWHGNQWKLRGLSCLDEQFHGTPNAATYWIPKIRRTMQRDIDTNEHLAHMGWTVIRCWESEISADIDLCVDRIERAVRGTQK